MPSFCKLELLALPSYILCYITVSLLSFIMLYTVDFSMRYVPLCWVFANRVIFVVIIKQ